MIDHSTSYPVVPHAGDLWTNTPDGTLLFVYRSHMHTKGVWSDGKIVDESELMHIQHGKDGWRRVYPSFPDAE